MICQAPLTQEAPCKVRKEYVREEICKFAASHLFLQRFAFVNVRVLLPVTWRRVKGNQHVSSIYSTQRDRDTPIKGQEKFTS